jgi:thiaminase
MCNRNVHIVILWALGTNFKSVVNQVSDYMLFVAYCNKYISLKSSCYPNMKLYLLLLRILLNSSDHNKQTTYNSLCESDRVRYH